MNKIFILGFLGITLMASMAFGMDVNNSDDSSNKLAQLNYMESIPDNTILDNLPEGTWNESPWSIFGRQAKGNIDRLLLETNDMKLWNGSETITTRPSTEARLQAKYAFYFVLHTLKAVEVRGEHVGINLAELPLQPTITQPTVTQPLWQRILVPAVKCAGLVYVGFLLREYINPRNQLNQ